MPVKVRSAGDAPPVLRARKPAGWAVSAVLALFAVSVAWNFWSAPTIDHGTVREYLFDDAIVTAAVNTVKVTIVAMVIGILLGLILALMNQNANYGLRTLSGLYIWIFRGTPVLLQIIIWFNLSLVYPSVVFGVPFTDMTLWSGSSNELVTPFAAAVLGLGLNEAAYMAEVFRGGLLSVDPGQIEAGRALGMTPTRVFRRITLPQALRIIVPPTGNQIAGMLKTTSLVSVIGYGELLLVSSRIYGQNLKVMELLIVSGFWYLAMTTLLTIIQRPIEGRLGRGHSARENTRRRLWSRAGGLEDGR